MSDLISRSALIEYLCSRCSAKCNLEEECCSHVDAIENAPAVDAVEVVRCEDCKHYDGQECFHPRAEMGDTLGIDPTDFCSYGERKEEAST